MYDETSPHWEIPSRKGKYPILRKNIKPHRLIKHAKVCYSIASFVFCKFFYHTYQDSLNQGTSRLRYSVLLLSTPSEVGIFDVTSSYVIKLGHVTFYSYLFLFQKNTFFCLFAVCFLWLLPRWLLVTRCY